MDNGLHMAIEVHAWLNDLRTTDPARARLVAEAVLALLAEGLRETARGRATS